MSAMDVGLHLSPQEALARDLIMQRVAARHRAERRRHPSRAALLLRSLADRLDHSDQAQGAQSLAPTHVSRSQVAAVAPGPHPTQTGRQAGPQSGPEGASQAGPHAGQPRPWSSPVRRAPHRHS